MKTILLTGATRGLGLAIARTLDDANDVELVLAVRDPEQGRAIAATLRRPAEVVRLDVSSLADVERFAACWDRPLFALVNNAGVQITGATEHTTEGIERTLATNHLGPLWLTLRLLPQLRGGRALTIGSGTHDPRHPLARLTGFRGGNAELSVEALARGEIDASSDRRRGLDRYATSKLLATAATMELARRHAATAFATLDPGMMPGTDLARTAPWLARLAWRTLLRWLVPVLPDASTPARSASTVCALLSEARLTSGEVYDCRGRPARWVWPIARDLAFGARVLDQSIAVLSSRIARPHRSSTRPLEGGATNVEACG
jgi:NAD(P)-dependent dehydrogenase (short-subunit alcohol dehydrogenase family)